jgi:P4 family phage/plasmid primase-like protien
MPKQRYNHEMAEAFIRDARYARSLIFIREWNQFCIYENGHYRQLSTDDFRRIFYAFMREQFADANITMALVSDITEQIKASIPRVYDEYDSSYIAFTDRLYNLYTYEFEEFDESKVTIHTINSSSADLDKPTPIFQSFLNTTLVDDRRQTDHDLVMAIQEMMGFYMLNDLKAHAVFFLVGRGANGKSVLMNIIRNMIGKDYISALSLQALTTNNFAISGLIGKKVNLCAEEESKYLRSDRFKALISGDPTTAERKHETAFTFSPKTKYMFATNAMPSFDGINYGIRRRMKIIPFKRIFKPDEQDRSLTEKLLTEIPGIVKFALDGAKRLITNNYSFTAVKSIEEALVEFENITSSALMFFREKYVVSQNPSAFISLSDIYAEYLTWCTTNSKRPMSSHNFHRDIGDNIFEGEKTIIRYRGGITARGRNIEPLTELAPPTDLNDLDTAKIFD